MAQHTELAAGNFLVPNATFIADHPQLWNEDIGV